jgi:uncharacterized protein YbaP (TraB family)
MAALQSLMGRSRRLARLARLARVARIAALLVLFPFASLGALAAERGFLWRVRDGAGTVYLAGSLHVLPSGARLPPPYLHAYDAAEGLVMELDLRTLETPEGLGQLVGALMGRALLPPDRSLRTLLGPERWSRLLQALRPMALPPEGLDRFEPWAVSLLLTSSSLQRSGFEAESGVEGQLLRRASADAKPIDALETLEQQLDLFDGLPEAEQVAMLDQSLAEWAAVPEQLAAMEATWRQGDGAAMETLLRRAFPEGSRARSRFLSQRNQAWRQAIEGRLRRADDTLVVVGALHLLGEDGLVALLRRRGLVVERVEAAP